MKIPTSLCILMVVSNLFLPAYGLAAELTALEKDYGRAFHTLKAAQTLNPDASKNQAPPLGLEGKVGEKVMQEYYKMFEKKEPTITNIINIGTGQ